MQCKDAYVCLRCLDSLLHHTVGYGLSTFASTVTEQPALCQRPTLVLTMDEGSPGYALVWWMAYHQQLRMAFLRDPLHRQWNDLTLALKATGLWWVVIMSTVAFNLSHGPWNGSSWFEKIREGGLTLLAEEGPHSALVNALYDQMCQDHGWKATGTTAQRKRLLNELRKGEALNKKGDNVALRRWFSWVSAAKKSTTPSGTAVWSASCLLA